MSESIIRDRVIKEIKLIPVGKPDRVGSPHFT